MPSTHRHWHRLTGLLSCPSPPLYGTSRHQEDGRMTYPAAPWTLKGYAIQTLQLVDRVQARSFVPSDLDIVPVLPGKTVGVVYLAAYGPGSVLTYHELIVVPALVRDGTHVGGWISHIYVDHPDAMAGGREIWGLPKELAQFTWQIGDERQVTVRQDERVVCTLHYGRPRRLWRQPLCLPVLSLRGAHRLRFTGIVTGRFGLGKGRLDVPAETPWAALGVAGAARTYHHDEMTLVAHAPRVIRHAAARRHASWRTRG
jgi:acetoacetate decarboxylase